LAPLFAAAIGEISADIAFEGWRRDIILRLEMGQLGGRLRKDYETPKRGAQKGAQS